MADTLAEIHNSTLQSSDFNSSGEATIVTTDSSTKHVIKDVQIEEGDSNFKVEPYLNIGGFNTVQLTANASGSEIVGPSSTVKLKTSTFPLVYQDYNFITQSSNSEFNAVTFPRVNNQEGYSTNIASTANAIGHSSFTQDYNKERRVYLNLGPNNYTLLIDTNLNSGTRLYLRDSSGTQIAYYGDSYMPWWFDDTQYAYRYNGSTNFIQRLDCYTGTLTGFKSFDNGASSSTYAKMFGVNNPDGTTAYLFFWSEQSGYASYYDFSTSVAKNYTSTGVSSCYHNMNNIWQAVMKTDGSIVHLSGQNTSTLYEYTWEPDTVYTTSKYNSYSNVNLSTGVQLWPNLNAHKQVLGSKLYYYADSGSPYANSELAFIDFDKTGDARFGTTGLTLGGATAYGYSVNLSKSTPDATTISGRTYNISPSFKIRMTGITST